LLVPVPSGSVRQVAGPAARQAGVPIAMRPVVEEIVALTDEFCAAHLDEEYASCADG
jgi:hypothetical protein